MLPSHERLHPGRLRLLGLLAMSLVFVSIGALMIAEGEWSGLLVGGFFGLCVVVFVPMLFSRWNHLHLDREGVRCRSLWRERRWRWEDIAELGVADFGAGACVAMRLVRPPDSSLIALSRATTGWDDALPDRYGLSASELLMRMNRWRAAGLGDADRHAAAAVSFTDGQR